MRKPRNEHYGPLRPASAGFDAANYVLALPQEQAVQCNRWRRAVELLLDQADVAAVSRQVYLALFLEGEARPQCDVPMIAIPKRQIDGSPS
jgi:hypothetical protein